jgi:hypothetical protein
MKKATVFILVIIGCLMFAAGCANRHRLQTREKLMAMSDRELVAHYEMLEMRLVDIDRARERSVEQEKDMLDLQYPREHLYELDHLHIGDEWYEVKEEKELTANEMRKRGLSPP